MLLALVPILLTMQAAPAKIAVIALATGDVAPSLADNLTELLVAEVVRRGGMEIAGKEEFRARLGVTEERRAIDCVGDMACLARVGTELGVTKVLSATIGLRGEDYLLSVLLFDLVNARIEGRVFKQIPGGLPVLIREVKDAAKRVFTPAPQPGTLRVNSPISALRVYLDDAFIGTTPIAKPDVYPGSHRLRLESESRKRLSRTVEVPAGEALELTIDPAIMPLRKRWPAYLAWGSLAASAATAALGAFLGVLSQESPRGATRRELLVDLERKVSDATAANTLFVASAALALTASGVFYVYRDDLFDVDVELAAGPRLLARLRF